MKILIRATNWIGDAVMSLPAVRAVAARYPEAVITVLAKPWVADVYSGEPSIARIIPLEGGSGLRDLRVKWQQARSLRTEGFDLGILLPNSFESAALFKAAGIRTIIGYNRDGRGLILPDAIDVPAAGEIAAHERYYYLEMLRRAGIIDSLPEVPDIRFGNIDQWRAQGEELFRKAGLQHPIVGVSPGAAFGTAKRWLPERFAEVASRLGGQVAVFGSPAEQRLSEEVARAAMGKSFAGSTALREFMSMIAACDVFLCNDSGAMHIAAAMGVRTVAVFGPTDEQGTGPVSPKVSVVRAQIECAPCKERECPLHHHRCMTLVTTDQVMAAARA